MGVASFDDLQSRRLSTGNQRLGLLAALLRAGAWPLAKQLLAHCAAAGVQAAAHQGVGRALAALLAAALQPIHDAIYPLPGALTPHIFEAVSRVHRWAAAHSACGLATAVVVAGLCTALPLAGGGRLV